MNVAGRVFDFLKEHVSMNMKATPEQKVEFNTEEKVYEIKMNTGERMK